MHVVVLKSARDEIDGFGGGVGTCNMTSDSEGATP